MQAIKPTVLGILIGLLLGGVFFAKAAPQQEKVSDVIRAKRFEVVDDKGMKRAELAYEQGRVTLGLSSLDGDKKVQTALGLSIGRDGDATLMMVNTEEKTGIELRLPAKGQPEISLEGKDGKRKVLLPE